MRARNELEEMQRANADFPIGRLQLGDYYFRQNNPQRAIKEYEMAIQMDSLLTLVYSNLATAYNLVGDNQQALETLDNLLAIEPEYARGYYLRGLLQHEVGNSGEAIANLEMSIKLDGLNFRAYFNLANLYFQNGALVKAERTISTGLRVEPNSEEGLNLLKLIQTNPEVNE